MCRRWEGWFVQAGVFDGDSFDSPVGNPRVNAHGTHLHLDSDQGALVLGEVGYGWNQSATSGALGGQLKLGAWYHTADFADNANPARQYEENFGGYVALEQLLWRESAASSSQGLEAFIRLGGGPENRSTFAFVLDAGLSYVGPLPGRDEDKATLGFVHADFSDSRDGYKAFSSYEQALELTYELVLRPAGRAMDQ
jgi:porin